MMNFICLKATNFAMIDQYYSYLWGYLATCLTLTLRSTRRTCGAICRGTGVSLSARGVKKLQAGIATNLLRGEYVLQPRFSIGTGASILRAH